jgi:hypothetical protein
VVEESGDKAYKGEVKMNLLQLNKRDYPSPDPFSLVKRILDARPTGGQFGYPHVSPTIVREYYEGIHDDSAAVYSLVKFGAFRASGGHIPDFSDLTISSRTSDFESFSAAFLIALLALINEREGLGLTFCSIKSNNFGKLIQQAVSSHRRYIREALEFRKHEELRKYVTTWAEALGVTLKNLNE